VLRARGASPEAQRALGELCAAYWQPVFQFLRRDGRDADSARELTQEFCRRLLARPSLGGVEPGRGRFRSYLLGAVKHFLAEERARAMAAKRGGGQPPVSFDAHPTTDTAGELAIPDPRSAVPDAGFDHEWAVTLVDRAVAALGAEAAAAGRGEPFAALKPWLLGDVPALSQAEAARRVGLSESAAKVAVHRWRKRFRELVKAEIAQTVSDPSQVQEELRYLIEVLATHGRSR
jgi:RNA polymerase sigma-70 factor (ECF subfamily)